MTLVEWLRHVLRLPQLLRSKLTHEFVQPIAPILLLLQERFVVEPFQVALGRRQCKAPLENGTARQDLRFLWVSSCQAVCNMACALRWRGGRS